jgi:hypothetical protein
MEFTVTIECDNDAFSDDPADEIVRLLEDIVEWLQAGRTEGPLIDYYGNTVGHYELTGEPEEDEDDDEMPDECRDIFERAQAGEDLEVLGSAQTANRVYDDGRWRVWIERVGPEDGYDGPPVTVEHYDGNRWSDFPTE